jgi:hypothetical protein
MIEKYNSMDAEVVNHRGWKLAKSQFFGAYLGA